MATQAILSSGTKFSEEQVATIHRRAGFTPNLMTGNTRRVVPDPITNTAWPWDLNEVHQVPEEEFISLFTSAYVDIQAEVRDKAELAPTPEAHVPNGYPAPRDGTADGGQQLGLTEPLFVTQLIESIKSVIMNGTDLSDEHVKAFLKLTVDDGVMGAEGSPALYLAIVTAALWTIHALLICPADEHVAWHDVAAHATVYQALALKVKAQTKVMADVLDDAAFDALSASLKASLKHRLDNFQYPETTKGSVPPHVLHLGSPIPAPVLDLSSLPKWSEVNKRNSSVDSTLLSAVKNRKQVTLQQAHAASLFLLQGRKQSVKLSTSGATTDGSIKVSTRVASMPIDTDTELREAVTYLARACAEVNQEFGWAMRTELTDTLLESAKSYGVTCATLYGNMILNNLHKYVVDRHAAFKKVYPEQEPDSSWLYEGVDFPLSETMLAQAKREAAQHKAGPSKKSQSRSARHSSSGNSPSGPKPPQHQLGADGKSSNAVMPGAKHKTTSEDSKAQPCYQQAAASPCRYFDRNTNRCPFAHGSKSNPRKAKAKKGAKRPAHGTVDVSSAEDQDDSN